MKYRQGFTLLLTIVLLFGLVSFGLFPLAQSALAQSADGLDDSISIPGQIPELQEQIEADMSPQTPGPNEKVLIELQAYGTDLDQANISWSVNGTKQVSGAGKKSFIFYTKGIGQTMTVVAAITPINGPTTDKTITVTPEAVDLLWDANTYTPPFYEGKALYTSQATINFAAIPDFTVNGKVIPTSDIIYKWSENGTVLGDKSGRGVDTLSFAGDILTKPTTVTLDATYAYDTTVEAVNTLTVEPVQPSVGLYEDNPLYGILFNKDIADSFALSQTEVKLNAFPYFYSVSNRTDPTLTYTWQINNDQILVPPQQSYVVFRNQTGQTGTSQVSAEIDNSNELLQSAMHALSISFGLKDTSSLFK